MADRYLVLKPRWPYGQRETNHQIRPDVRDARRRQRGARRVPAGAQYGPERCPDRAAAPRGDLGPVPGTFAGRPGEGHGPQPVRQHQHEPLERGGGLQPHFRDQGLGHRERELLPDPHLPRERRETRLRPAERPERRQHQGAQTEEPHDGPGAPHAGRRHRPGARHGPHHGRGQCESLRLPGVRDRQCHVLQCPRHADHSHDLLLGRHDHCGAVQSV